jgi:hypothetical protein
MGTTRPKKSKKGESIKLNMTFDEAMKKALTTQIPIKKAKKKPKL